MTSHVGLDFLFHLRLYERGELEWKAFAERPQQYFEEVTFSPAVRYTIEERLICAAGFRSFVQNRYVYDGTARVSDGNFFSYGPTTSIVLVIPPGWKLEIQGWKEFQKRDKPAGTQRVEYYDVGESEFLKRTAVKAHSERRTMQKTFRITMGSNPKNVHRVEEFLLKMNSALHIDDEKFGSLLVVVTEAVNNAIIHGNKRNPTKKFC